MKKNNLTLEEAFKELDKIVNKLDQDDNTIEEVIKLFKKGNDLSKICRDKLTKAESLVSKEFKKNR